jgi:hypothetical protein
MSKNKPSLKEKEELTGKTMAQQEMQTFDDHLYINPAIIAEIKAKGLVHRWINAHKLQQMHGFDSRAWTPYKLENPNNNNNIFGKDAEGYLRRGDLILAVQTQQIFDQRKARVDMRRQALNNAVHNKEAAQQLKKSMRDAGIKSKVYEGFDENGEE